MLTSNIKRFFFILLIFLFSLLKSVSAFATNDSLKKTVLLSQDSSKIQTRQLNPAEQQKLLDDPDYKYDRVGPAPKNWWDKLKEWFWRSVGKMFDTRGGAAVLGVLPYIIVFTVIVIVILLLVKNDIRAVFYGKSASVNIDFREFEEDIHNLNFDELIADAVKKNDYRKAVRLHFLKLLKELADKNLITWQIDKTNNDYSIELSKSRFSKKFSELAMLYEYIWYGDFHLDEHNFKNSIAKFQEFKVNV